MKKLIGNKSVFAVEIEFIQFKPFIWGKTALWINNEQIGLFEDENMLGPFIGQLSRIATNYQYLWEPELEGLECKEMFLVIHPFFENPYSLYDLPFEETEKYVKYDKFIMQLGENFDKWSITVVVRDDICKFLWFPDCVAENEKRLNFENNIKCFDVSIKHIQNAYKEICTLIPDEHWPRQLNKL